MFYVAGFICYIDIFWHEGYPFQKYDIFCIILLIMALFWPLYLFTNWLYNKIVK